jgi:hypothetical protein
MQISPPFQGGVGGGCTRRIRHRNCETEYLAPDLGMTPGLAGLSESVVKAYPQAIWTADNRGQTTDQSSTLTRRFVCCLCV